MNIFFMARKRKSFINLNVSNNKAMNYRNEALHKIQGEMERNAIAMEREPLTDLFQVLAIEQTKNK